MVLRPPQNAPLKCKCSSAKASLYKESNVFPPHPIFHNFKMADPNGLKLYTLFDLSSEYPVGIRICHFLSIADIIALTRTCRTLSSLYKSLIPSQWNLNSRLQPFVDNVTGFRSEMAKCDALISGSFALQFFDRTLWPRSDLDINVRNSAEQFERYLRNVEGYKLLRSTEGKNYDMVGVDKVTSHRWIFGESN